MAYDLKEGQGSLFPNDFKKSDSHPSMKGTVKVNGEVMEIAAWPYVTREGKKWLSLKVQPKRQGKREPSGRGAAPAEPEYKGEDKPFDDEVPF